MQEKMQTGGTTDFKWCKVTMVKADHSSTCTGPQGLQITGGNANGFTIEIPHHDVCFYHAGDTSVFSDMKIIQDLYKPNIAFLPIGGTFGMGPREAAYSLKHFLVGIKTVIPMHFGTSPVLTGTPEDFERELRD